MRTRGDRDPILPLDEWISASVRRTVVAFVAGLLILAGGVLWWRLLDLRVDHRVAAGHPVGSEVIAVRSEKVATVARAQRVTVRYTVDGRDHEVTLMATLKTGHYRQGQRVTVYTDRDDPTRVATVDGFASEGWLMRAPTYVWAVGAGIILIVGVARIMRLIRRRRR